MTSLSRIITTSAILAAALNTATAVFIVLAINRPSTVLTIAILACVFHCIIGCIDVASLFLTKWRSCKYQKVSLIFLSLVPLGLTGAVLVIITLDQQSMDIGERFCGDKVRCLWRGNRSLVIAYMLWFGTGLLQTMYLAWTLSSSQRSVQSTIPASTQSTPVRLNEPSVANAQRAFRYPLMRQTTDDEPFSYDVALAKAEMPPPRLQNVELSVTQETTYVQSHVVSSRSWASTQPTVVNSASPGSLQSKRKHYNSDGEITSRYGSPERNDWKGWGIAFGSPTHKLRTQNASVSNTYSSTSSTRSRPSKKLTNLHFHLPKSPVTRLDIRSKSDMDETTLQNPPMTPSPAVVHMEHSRSESMDVAAKSTTVSERQSTPRRRKQSSLQLANLLSATTHRLSVSGLSERSSHTSRAASPERKRSSIFGALKPRLPEAMPTSPTKLPLSRTNSPSKTTIKSSARSSFFKLYDDTAFSEWDTSRVESDPSYLVSMTDSRDLSGSRPPREPSIESARSASSTDSVDRASVWAGRSVRVSSDGSVVARMTPTRVMKLSQL